MGEVSENERHEKETRAAFLSFLVYKSKRQGDKESKRQRVGLAAKTFSLFVF